MSEELRPTYLVSRIIEWLLSQPSCATLVVSRDEIIRHFRCAPSSASLALKSAVQRGLVLHLPGGGYMLSTRAIMGDRIPGEDLVLAWNSFKPTCSAG